MITIISLALIALSVLYSAGLLFFLIGLFFPKGGRNRRRYSVSVVMAARNEEKTITHCLTDLVHQTYPKDQYEVIVVDDDSKDKTAEIVSQFGQDHPHIKLLKADSMPGELTPKKLALHTGIVHSRGEIILTLDADCRVKSTWIETTVSYFDPGVGMVVGFSQLGEKREKLNLFERLQALDFLSLMAAAAGSTNLGFPLAASGQNLAYRKQVFEEVGGFEKIGHRVSGDDILLLQLVRGNTPWQIRFAASERAFNSSRPEHTLKDFLNQRKRWASNGSYQFQLNKVFFLYILVVFFLNLLLLLSLPIAVSYPGEFAAPLICLAAKAAVEFSLTLRGGMIFNRLDLVKYFPLWAVLQIPYVVLTGLLGTFGNFTWKERRH